MDNYNYFGTNSANRRLEIIINAYILELKNSGVEILASQKKDIVKNIIVIYKEYNSTFRTAHITDIDPLKTISWIPTIIIRNNSMSETAAKHLIFIAAKLLDDELKKSKVVIFDEWLYSAVYKTYLAAKNQNIPTWQSPLYIAMKTANSCRPQYPWMKWAYRAASGGL